MPYKVTVDAFEGEHVARHYTSCMSPWSVQLMHTKLLSLDRPATLMSTSTSYITEGTQMPLKSGTEKVSAVSRSNYT